MQVNNTPPNQVNPYQADQLRLQPKPLEQEKPKEAQETPAPQAAQETRVYTAQRDTVAEVRRKPDVAANQQLRNQEEASFALNNVLKDMTQNTTTALKAQGNVDARNVVALIR